MKPILVATALFILVLSVPAEGAANADCDIRVGDPAELVRALLGEPRGYLGSAGHEILVYPRGKIEIRDGLVVDVDLVSSEEAERLRSERERALAQRRAQEARERERLRIEGIKVKEDALSDPGFPSLSPSARLAFWREFSMTYPDVPVDLELAKARAMVREEQKRRRDELRLVALERRLAEAERQAERAEREAREARRRWNRYDVWYVPPCAGYYSRGAASGGRSGRKHPGKSANRHARRREPASVAEAYGFRKNYSTMPARVDQTTRDIERVRSGPNSPAPAPNSFFTVPYSLGAAGSVDPSRDPALHHAYAGGSWTIRTDR